MGCMLFSTDLEADFWAYLVDDDAVLKEILTRTQGFVNLVKIE